MNKFLLPSALAMHDDRNYRRPPHIKLIEMELWRLLNTELQRLAIALPPRHGKSEYISKYAVAWYLMQYPNKRVILASYEADFAKSWGRKAKALIDAYGSLYGVSLSSNSKASDRFELSNGSSLNTAGAGGAITGKGADLLIIDDPIKNDEVANSATQRNKIYEWFVSTAYTRLEPGGKIILIQTRWNDDDLMGRLLAKQSDKWKLVSIPAIAIENDILGRKVGEPLWNERYNLEALNNIKSEIGSYWWNALYQQTPVVGEYQMFKPSWWKYYKERPSGGMLIQSWDTAFKDKEMNDYSVCETWQLVDGAFYLVDVLRKKLEFPELFRQFIAHYDKYKPGVVLIEDKASGQSLIQILQRDTSIPIKAISVKADKVTRAGLVNMLHEKGDVYLPERAEWLADFLNETDKFPYGGHDDQVDAMTQALSYLRQYIRTDRNTSIFNLNKTFNQDKSVRQLISKY